MATSHQILTNVISQNGAVPESVNKMARYIVQRAVPNIAYATADQAVAGTTLTASTYLTIANSVGYNQNAACVGGRWYSVEGYLATSVGASGGIKISLGAGTATATDVQLTVEDLVAGGLATYDLTALNGANGAATTGVLGVRITGSFKCTGSGSLALSFAEFAAVSSATVKKGSWLKLTEIALANAP